MAITFEYLVLGVPHDKKRILRELWADVRLVSRRLHGYIDMMPVLQHSQSSNSAAFFLPQTSSASFLFIVSGTYHPINDPKANAKAAKMK